MSRAVTLAPTVVGTPLAARLADPEGLLATSRGEVVKDHLRTAVSRVRVDGAEVYVKRFKPYAWYRRLAVWWSGSPARRSWDMAKRLSVLGFSPVPVLAIVEVSRFGIPSDAYLLSAAVAEATPAGSLWLDEADSWPLPVRRRFVREAGRSLRRLHDAGVYTRDANPNNFLVERSAAGTPAFRLLDLEAFRDVGRVSRARRVKNLVQLQGLLHGRVAPGERLRLLHAYLGAGTRNLRAWSDEIVLADRRKRVEYERRARRPR